MNSFLNWLRSELRLMRLHSWESEDMSYQPCSSEDPACKETIKRQDECRDRMRRMKSSLLDGKQVNGDYFAHTDTKTTIRRAQSIGPVRMVQQKRIAR